MPTHKGQFCSALSFAVCWAVTPNFLTRKSLEKVWARGTGKSWKQLRELAARVEGWARELEPVTDNVFASVFFVDARRRTLRFSMSRQDRVSLQQMMQISDTLRRYAEGLHAYVYNVQRFTRKVFPLSPCGYRSEDLAWVSQIVKEFTGRYHDAEVAELLEAAASTFGLPWEFTYVTFLKARFRQKRLARRNGSPVCT